MASKRSASAMSSNSTPSTQARSRLPVSRPSISETPTPSPEPQTRAPPPVSNISRRQLEEATRRANASRAGTPGLPYRFLVHPKPIIGALLLLLGAAIGSYASQLTLSPVYGGVPTSLHHEKVCAAIFAAAWGGKSLFKRIPLLRPFLIVPILAFYLPAIQRFLFRYSQTWGPVNGPIFTETLSYFPSLFLVVLTLSYRFQTHSIILDTIPGGLTYGVFRGFRLLLSTYLPQRIGTAWIFTRCGLAHLAGILYSIVAPTALLLAAVPAFLHAGLMNPGCSNYAATHYLNSSLAATNFTVLAHTESITGYVSVMENSYHRYRVMRCDHSLLGGEWIKAPPGFEHLEVGHKEPIYAVFVMLEAVRLVRPAPASRKPKALMM